MKERDLEDIVAKYPSIIEVGLNLKGRQVNVQGKYIDLLFEDKFGQKLIVELKRGTIVRKHIAQLMDYEGYLLSSDDPTVRVMLIGNRVPINLRRSLDHHGFEWKELSFTFLSQFLTEQNEQELLDKIPIEEKTNSQREDKKRIKPKNGPLINKERTLFWTELLEKTNRKMPLNFSTPSKPLAVYASAGKTGMKWVYAVKKYESWVELEIMLPGDKAKSHQIFDELLTFKSETEEEFGCPIKWEKIDSRKSCRIQTFPHEKIGIDKTDKWSELQNTLIVKMEKMVRIFSPYIQQL